MRFNTAIAAMMEFSNGAAKWEAVPKTVAETFVLMLSPFAPHLAEEIWSKLGHDETLAYEPWPEVVEDYLKADEKIGRASCRERVETSVLVGAFRRRRRRGARPLSGLVASQ